MDKTTSASPRSRSRRPDQELSALHQRGEHLAGLGGDGGQRPRQPRIRQRLSGDGERVFTIRLGPPAAPAALRGAPSVHLTDVVTSRRQRHREMPSPPGRAFDTHPLHHRVKAGEPADHHSQPNRSVRERSSIDRRAGDVSDGDADTVRAVVDHVLEQRLWSIGQVGAVR